MNDPINHPEQTKTEKCADWMQRRMDKQIATYRVKNIAYGDSFGKQFQKYGAISALVRISDKFQRFESLVLGAKNGVSDEALTDTLVDMANYCMMTAYELEHKGEIE